MIGVFLKNEEGTLCFVQPPQASRPTIAEFHYADSGHIVTLTLEDGGHETITAEIAAELRDAFAKEKTILVVHVDANSSFEHEYEALLTR